MSDIIDLEEHKRMVSAEIIEMANRVLSSAQMLVVENVNKLEGREVGVEEMKAGVLVLNGADDSKTWHWQGKKIVKMTGLFANEGNLRIEILDLLNIVEGM